MPKQRSCMALSGGLALSLSLPGALAATDPAILQELRALRERLSELEDVKRRVAELEAELARRDQEAAAVAAAPAAAVTDDLDAKAGRDTLAAAPQPETGIRLGGALRFNYRYLDDDPGSSERRGDAGLDLFRLNLDGELDRLQLSAEYRFYGYMDSLHHGWVGYQLTATDQLQLGVHRIPFGLLPYAAHNYWFGIPFYLGLADNYDLGLKYLAERGPWDLQLGFYKNGELGSAGNLDRYGYDPVSVGEARNQETNTVNARLAYRLGDAGRCEHELGLSAQRGGLYNTDTNDTGAHWAAALHSDSRCGRWNLQLELGRYGHDPRNPAGVPDDRITLGGFAFTHDIAADGDFGAANIAYNLPVQIPGVQLVTCYNDFSWLHKRPAGMRDSYLNTTGCLLQLGPVFAYLDLIHGRNAVFVGGGSLADGGNDDWERRVNVNLGYYW